MNNEKIVIKRIGLEGIYNTRDLGEFPTTDGRRIKSKRLIRSGELFKLTKNDMIVLKHEYKLKTIVDFRTDIEADDKPDPEICGVEYIHNPIFDSAAMGITREKNALSSAIKMIKSMEESADEYIENMYKSIAFDEYAQKQYMKFFDILLNSKSGSVLWHCSAGKDRAGVGTLLVLSALGVDKKLIIKDYLATGKFGEKYNKKYITLANVLVRDRKVAEYAKTFLGVKKEYIQSVIDEIELKYESMDNYLEKCLNLTDEKKEMLRKLYLE